MTKPLLWFRFYGEAVDDEKLRLLAFEDRWHFVALLCCKAAGILDGEDADLRNRKVAVKLGLDLRELGEVARRLEAVGLICAETFQPLAWDQRQRKSDHDGRPPERLREWREKKRTEREPEVNLKRTKDTLRPETETETETEKDEDLRSLSSPVPGKALPACPAEEIVNLYHATLPALPHVVALSDKRKRLLSSRWREVVAEDRLSRDEGVEFFRRYFTKVSRSKFLTGKVKPQGDRSAFKADFEWLLLPSNFIKVVEGRYE